MILENDFEHRLSPSFVFFGLIAAALAFTWLADSAAALDRVSAFSGLALLAYAVAVIVWSIRNHRSIAARALVILSLVGLIYLSAIWLRAPVVLALLYIPAGLSVNMLGWRWALVVTLLATAPLTFLPHSIGLADHQTECLIALLATWGAFIFVAALYRFIHQRDRWVQSYAAWAQQQAHDAQASRAETAQVLAQLQHDNRELALANERMNALRMIAEDAEKTKAEFVTRVSHELRTPLNMIIGLVELMVHPSSYGTSDLMPETEEDLRIVLRNSRHLSALIDDVLDLARSETGRLTLHREWVSLGAIADEAMTAVRPLALRKGLHLDISVQTGMPDVYCDRTRIRQVLLNLVSNATRMTDAGRVSIAIMARGDKAIACVSDTGPGIPPEDCERIFQPFVQGRQDRGQDRGGSGLGLSISQRFVQLHRGRLWVESQVGVGSTFTVELPITQPVDPHPGPARWISEEWPWRQRKSDKRNLAADHLSGFMPRLLLCDATDTLGPQLERYADTFDFVSLEDLTHALRYLKTHTATALVIAERTPEEALTSVQHACLGVQNIPVIGCCVPVQLANAQRSNVRGHLIKPISLDSLRQALDQAPGTPQRVMVVDDDPDLLLLLPRMLRECRPDLEIVSANSGAQALAQLRLQPCDLVFLDVVMPGMSGWQVLERLRAAPNLATIAVYLVTAQDPTDRPGESVVLIMARQGGFSIPKIVDCSLELSNLLFTADPKLDSVPPEELAARPALG